MKQAVEELLPMWTEIDTDDALELLGPGIVDSRVGLLQSGNWREQMMMQV